MIFPSGIANEDQMYAIKVVRSTKESNKTSYFDGTRDPPLVGAMVFSIVPSKVPQLYKTLAEAQHTATKYQKYLNDAPFSTSQVEWFVRAIKWVRPTKDVI
jgi:hypothetical protein